jgi:hypothetical protein
MLRSITRKLEYRLAKAVTSKGYFRLYLRGVEGTVGASSSGS